MSARPYGRAVPGTGRPDQPGAWGAGDPRGVRIRAPLVTVGGRRGAGRRSGGHSGLSTPALTASCAPLSPRARRRRALCDAHHPNSGRMPCVSLPVPTPRASIAVPPGAHRGSSDARPRPIAEDTVRITPLNPEDPSVLGDFELLGRIGHGGMGQVFLGESLGGEPAAVKVIKPSVVLPEAPQDARLALTVSRRHRSPHLATRTTPGHHSQLTAKARTVTFAPLGATSPVPGTSVRPPPYSPRLYTPSCQDSAPADLPIGGDLHVHPVPLPLAGAEGAARGHVMDRPNVPSRSSTPRRRGAGDIGQGLAVRATERQGGRFRGAVGIHAPLDTHRRRHSQHHGRYRPRPPHHASTNDGDGLTRHQAHMARRSDQHHEPLLTPMGVPPKQVRVRRRHLDHGRPR